jgi:hypothetical protein
MLRSAPLKLPENLKVMSSVTTSDPSGRTVITTLAMGRS